MVVLHLLLLYLLINMKPHTLQNPEPEPSIVSFKGMIILLSYWCFLFSLFPPKISDGRNIRLSSNCLIHCFEVTPQQRTNTASSLTCVCTSAPKYHVQTESELVWVGY